MSFNINNHRFANSGDSRPVESMFNGLGSAGSNPDQAPHFGSTTTSTFGTTRQPAPQFSSSSTLPAIGNGNTNSLGFGEAYPSWSENTESRHTFGAPAFASQQSNLHQSFHSSNDDNDRTSSNNNRSNNFSSMNFNQNSYGTPSSQQQPIFGSLSSSSSNIFSASETSEPNPAARRISNNDSTLSRGDFSSTSNGARSSVNSREFSGSFSPGIQMSRQSSIIRQGLEDIQNLLDETTIEDVDDYLSYVQKENKLVIRDLQLKKQKEEAEIASLNQKLSQVNMTRQDRVQSYLKELERKRIEEERGKLEVERKKREAARKQLEEENRKLEEERKAEEQALNQLLHERKEQQRLEKERIVQEKLRKDLEQQKILLMKQVKEEEERKLREAKESAVKQQAELEKKKKEEAEKKKSAAAEALLKEQQQAASKAAASENSATSSIASIKDEFLKNKKKISDIKAGIVLPITNNPASKELVTFAKRKIRPKMGQLTSSRQKLLDVYQHISQFIRECRESHGSPAYLFVLNFFSKSVLDQAETEVSVAIDRALALGTLCCYLMVEFPELTELLIARFIKKCPYLIGYTCSIATNEGRKDMGWRESEDPSQYNERMAGIVAVWAVITTCQPLNPETDVHPYPISNSWVFLARVVNTPSQYLTENHFAVVNGWWEVASRTFLKFFGKQGRKILEATCVAWPATVSQLKLPAALRLQLIGDDWKAKGEAATKLPKPLEP